MNNYFAVVTIIISMVEILAGGILFWKNLRYLESEYSWGLILLGAGLAPIAVLFPINFENSHFLVWALIWLCQIFSGIGIALKYHQTNNLERHQYSGNKEDSDEITQLLVNPITGLPNQRQFELKFRTIFHKNIKEHTPLTLLSIGIDDFKAMGVSFGQEGIEAILKHIAWLLAKSIRDVDLMAHTAPSEFHIAIEGLDVQSTAIIAERIRSKIESTPLQLKNKQLNVKCSIGVITIAEDATIPNSPASLIKAADTALLLARQKGGNKVILG